MPEHCPAAPSPPPCCSSTRRCSSAASHSTSERGWEGCSWLAGLPACACSSVHTSGAACCALTNSPPSTTLAPPPTACARRQYLSVQLQYGNKYPDDPVRFRPSGTLREAAGSGGRVERGRRRWGMAGFVWALLWAGRSFEQGWMVSCSICMWLTCHPRAAPPLPPPPPRPPPAATGTQLYYPATGDKLSGWRLRNVYIQPMDLQETDLIRAGGEPACAGGRLAACWRQARRSTGQRQPRRASPCRPSSAAPWQAAPPATLTTPGPSTPPIPTRRHSGASCGRWGGVSCRLLPLLAACAAAPAAVHTTPERRATLTTLQNGMEIYIEVDRWEGMWAEGVPAAWLHASRQPARQPAACRDRRSSPTCLSAVWPSRISSYYLIIAVVPVYINTCLVRGRLQAGLACTCWHSQAVLPGLPGPLVVHAGGPPGLSAT